MSVPAANRSTPVSRMKEIWLDAGVTPRSSGNCSARRAKAIATRVCPESLAPARRPRLRCLDTLMKSSRNPTKPRPLIRNSTSRAETVGARQVIRCATA